MSFIFKRVNVRGHYRVFGFKDGRLFLNQKWISGAVEGLRKAHSVLAKVERKVWKVEIMRGFAFYPDHNKTSSPEYRQVRFAKYFKQKPSKSEINEVRKEVERDFAKLEKELEKYFGSADFRTYVDSSASAEEIRLVDIDELRGAKIGQLIRYSQKLRRNGEEEWRRIK